MLIPEEAARIIRHTLTLEGGYNNIPGDNGGETNFGISKKAYPNEDIRAMTIERATELAYRDYYEKFHLELIQSFRIRAKVFDTGFNAYPTTAIKFLQRALGVHDDGVIGMETLTAIVGKEENTILYAMIKQQMLNYVRIVSHAENQAQFLAGWTNRAFDIIEA